MIRAIYTPCPPSRCSSTTAFLVSDIFSPFIFLRCYYYYDHIDHIIILMYILFLLLLLFFFFCCCDLLLLFYSVLFFSFFCVLFFFFPSRRFLACRLGLGGMIVATFPIVASSTRAALGRLASLPEPLPPRLQEWPHPPPKKKEDKNRSSTKSQHIQTPPASGAVAGSKYGQIFRGCSFCLLFLNF